MSSDSSLQDVALGLGSNLNNRHQQLQQAIRRLDENGFAVKAQSTFYDTAPVDCVPGTPRFLNAAVIGKWRGSPEALLELCKKIETGMGRPENHSSEESRVIDIDILLFNEKEISVAGLQIPHPKMGERRFILAPLCEIAPDWFIPSYRQTVAEVCATLPD
ncbi:MAG: 2-amino-4-hydroxy-6-hydroxymethyldihydropteridine diphosphokinase [Lentisphaeria bacterium]